MLKHHTIVLENNILIVDNINYFFKVQFYSKTENIKMMWKICHSGFIYKLSLYIRAKFVVYKINLLHYVVFQRFVKYSKNKISVKSKRNCYYGKNKTLES